MLTVRPRLQSRTVRLANSSVLDMRNALVCAAGKDSVNADMDRVLVTAPQWLNEDDVDAGAGRSDDIYFESNDYQKGDAAVGPGDVNISSFEAYVEVNWLDYTETDKLQDG